jgi:uncharacterized protein YqjF (DUF2071 family)
VRDRGGLLNRTTGFQRWRTLLFLHWQVDEAALRALLPPRLTLDTFQGRAYVGVVPFLMRDVRPRWAPAVPGISNFAELNVRTYVHHEGQDPGVWFFSLDAARLLAVLVGRWQWNLPYVSATMRCDIDGDSGTSGGGTSGDTGAADGAEVRYRSRRRWPSPPAAELAARYRIGPAIGPARPGTLEYFLVERYLLYAETRQGQLYSARVHHRPYPLHRAELTDLRETVVAAAGLPRPAGEPHVLYSPGVDVEMSAARPLAADVSPGRPS